MYETASDILKLEGVLKLITLIAVMIIFFIILIGVINTLRMSIRERTREIGTIRSIGMQRGDVKKMFLIETMMLTFISSVTGICLALISIVILGHFTIHTQSALNILLVDKHLHFVPIPISILKHVILIHIIAFITAYFPAQSAAKLEVTDALRHYE